MNTAAQALLNYLEPTAQPLHTYSYDPPDGNPRFNGQLQDYRMPVSDARSLKPSATLDSHGFTMAHAPSAVTDFWNEIQVRDTYYAESARLLMALTGARQVLVFDHTLRRRAAHRPQLDGMGGSFSTVREPVGRVHLDFTPRSGPVRIRQVLGLPPDEPMELQRYVIYGMWRCINDAPLEDAPLALADCRTVNSKDLVPNKLIYPDRTGETYAITRDASHRWFYYPRQTRDEVIVFRHFSGSDVLHNVNTSVPHSAIENPQACENPPPRQSIELRVLALF